MMRIRDARKTDCAELAELVDLAGEGLPYYHWQQIAEPGQDPWEIGRERATRETGSFSYRNGVVAEVDGKIAGALVCYRIADEPEAIDTESTPPMWIPLLELESIAAGTWYINTVAVFTEARGLGVGSKLLQWAEQTAANLGLRGTSLIVSDANHGARRLYDRLGYEEVASRPMVKEQWRNDGENWVLMIRENKGTVTLSARQP
jgi:ribosomal protein S18 acetylase RimI-like enzyme